MTLDNECQTNLKNINYRIILEANVAGNNSRRKGIDQGTITEDQYIQTEIRADQFDFYIK